MIDTPPFLVPQARAGSAAQVPSAPSIAAVVVTRGVSNYLAQTLAALAAQSRLPARVIVVDAAPRPDAGDDLAADDAVGTVVRSALAPLTARGVPVRACATPGARTFGAAVREALAAEAGPAADWLWLLHDDSAPEPGALAELARAVEHSPSVAIAGVKQRSWAEPSRLLEVGVTTSRFGRRMTDVDDDEVDQGQHDGREDVYGVGIAGALVRRVVWDELGGTDVLLGPFGDGLDLCRRARLAGHRVIVVPAAIVRHAQASYRGLRAGDELDEPDPRRSFAARRRAQVHARLTAVPVPMLPFLGAGYLAAGVVRSLVRVASKEPSLAIAELAAPVAALVHPARMARARTISRRSSHVQRRALRPLQTTWRDVARQQRDSHFARVELRRVHSAPSELELSELAALATRRRVGLAALTVGLLALTALVLGDLFTGAITGSPLVGGALLPAQLGAGELWNAATSGWVSGDLGAPGPADPLLVVLAALATVTRSGTGAVDVLFLGSLALAGLGAWFAAGAATRSVGLRLWAALVWVAAPALALAVDGGRLGAVVAHVALPWVALGVARAVGVQRRDVVLSGMVGARRTGPAPADLAVPGGSEGVGPARSSGSIGAAAAAGLALAVAAAGAPVLLPVGILALLAVALVVPRRRWRLALVALPALALLGPTLQAALTGTGTWRVLFSDGGVPVASRAAAPWQELLAWPVHPTPLALGWLGQTVSEVLPFALGAVVALLALLALLRGAPVARGVRIGWVVVACGLGAALASGRVETAAGSSVVVRGWPGAGVSMVLLGLLTAAVLGGDGLRARIARETFGWRQFVVVVLTVLAVLAPLIPLADWAVRARTSSGADSALEVAARDGVVVPAVGQQAQTSTDRSRVLSLGLAPDGSVRYQLLRADGAQVSELAPAVEVRSLLAVAGDPGAPAADAASVRVAGVVARLSASAAGNVSADLSELAVAAVLVPPAHEDAKARAVALRSALVSRLDATAGLERITENSSGVIWRVVPAAGASAAGAAWARVTTTDASGATVASERLRAGRHGVDARVAEGDPDRTVVLAERADAGWHASIDGHPLRVVSGDWRQEFALGADGGRLVISYSGADRLPWLVVQGIVGLLSLLLAIPVRRRRGGVR